MFVIFVIFKDFDAGNYVRLIITNFIQSVSCIIDVENIIFIFNLSSFLQRQNLPYSQK